MLKPYAMRGLKVKAKLGGTRASKSESLKAKIEALLLELPNIPSDSTPVGKDESENVEVTRWGDEYIPQS